MGPARRLCLALAGFFLAAALFAGQGLPARDARAADETSATVLGVRFGDHLTKLRLVLDISGEPEFEISYSADPMAVLVDFPPLGLDVPASRPGIGFIERYEFERRLGGGTRIRLLLSRPARAGQVFYLPETPAEAPRFVLDLTPTTRDDLTTLADMADEPLNEPPEPLLEAPIGAPIEELASEPVEIADGPDEPQEPQEPAADPVADIIQTASLVVPSPEDLGPLAPTEAMPEPEEALVPAPGTPADEAPADAAAAENSAGSELWLAAMPIPQPKPPPPDLPLIVLDPGHGGFDPGAVSKSGVREKDITMRAARTLQRLLRRSGRYAVALTREDDSFVPLRERVNVARHAGAAMFLSLHADSIDDPHVRGASVYTLSKVASDREAAALAGRENRPEALTGVDLNEQDDDMTVSILIDLAQRQSRSYSSRLADLVIGGIADVQPTVNNTHRQAGFAVLTAPDMPSVLIELGYLSSDADVRMLRDERHILRLMESLSRSIDQYFDWQEDRRRS